MAMYENQMDAKAAAQEIANRLGFNVYIVKRKRRYEVVTQITPEEHAIVIVPTKGL